MASSTPHEGREDVDAETRQRFTSSADATGQEIRTSTHILSILKTPVLASWCTYLVITNVRSRLGLSIRIRCQDGGEATLASHSARRIILFCDQTAPPRVHSLSTFTLLIRILGACASCIPLQQHQLSAALSASRKPLRWPGRGRRYASSINHICDRHAIITLG